MKPQKQIISSIDDYIKEFPKDVQKKLEEVRSTIQKAAPRAQETIKYGIPTFTLDGNLVHFGAYKQHIGFYPTPSAITAFKKELSQYVSAKGSVQFPLNASIPLPLITKIVKWRIQDIESKKKPVAAKK